MDTGKTIAQQIGQHALAMLGAYHFVGVRNGLTFRIKGSRSVNSIQILLTPKDTYTVEFAHITEDAYTIVAEIDDVYVDNMRTVIEKGTGLSLTLIQTT